MIGITSHFFAIHTYVYEMLSKSLKVFLNLFRPSMLKPKQTVLNHCDTVSQIGSNCKTEKLFVLEPKSDPFFEGKIAGRFENGTS